MSILKSFTLKWWQVGLFKLSLIAAGIAIGAYWWQFFTPAIVPLLIIAIVCGLYIGCVWWKQ